MTEAPDDSAANPCGASISVRRLPIVSMMRQPPTKVPAAMATPQLTFTHSGTVKWSASRLPWAMRASVMIPIVFCASLVPWASETSEAEPICPSR
jgi:hypothetical protein